MRLWIIIGLLSVLVIQGCLRGAQIKLGWAPNPSAEEVTEYRVWRGIDCIGTTSESEITLTLPDEPCSLTVTARNAAGESAHSAPLDIIAVTVEGSEDLKTWTALKTLHVPRETRAFFRLKVETEGTP